jgi:acyl-CoA reductase-like NAD-dependent aldehyde dehydrogenase
VEHRHRRPLALWPKLAVRPTPERENGILARGTVVGFHIYTGIVYVNAPTIGAEMHLPFGGTKQTGNGHRKAAISAIDFFTERKTPYIDYSDTLQRA